MQEWTDFLCQDLWLSQTLGCEAFSFSLSELKPGTRLKKTKLSPNSFVYAKISVNDQETIQVIQSLGFLLVDTQVQLVKSIQSRIFFNVQPGRVRMATDEDRERVIQIARKSFVYSRFHRDSHFEKDVADNLKAAWTNNYFNGLRGDGLLIAEYEGLPSAFLLFIQHNQSWIIDLIATDPDYQRLGLGADLLSTFEAWAPPEIINLKVGTQLINLPSLRLYLRSGYQISEAFYMFHFHQESN